MIFSAPYVVAANGTCQASKTQTVLDSCYAFCSCARLVISTRKARARLAQQRPACLANSNRRGSFVPSFRLCITLAYLAARILQTPSACLVRPTLGIRRELAAPATAAAILSAASARSQSCCAPFLIQARLLSICNSALPPAMRLAEVSNCSLELQISRRVCVVRLRSS